MSEGLRARKKRATVNAIERAAVGLALEKGHSRVTIAEIVEGAEISRSTFFNYMVNREAAIFGRPLAMVPFEEAWGLMEKCAPDSLLRALYEVTTASIGGAEINAEVAAGRKRLAVEQPDCAVQMLLPFAALSTQLTGLLHLWFEADPSRRHMPDIPLLRETSLTVGLLGNAVQSVLAEVTGVDDTEMGVDYTAEVVSHASTIAARLDSPSG